MSVANLCDRIADAGPAAMVLVAATLALLAIPLLRRLAARGQQRRGGPARLFLGLAVVLSLGAIAIGTMGVVSPGSVLHQGGRSRRGGVVALSVRRCYSDTLR